MRNRGRQCGGRGCQRRLSQFLDPALLLLLQQAPAHGYTLLNRLQEFGLDFLAPTVIYRALRNMASRGWITSEMDAEETLGPPRRVYSLTPVGLEVLRCCTVQLQATRQITEYFLALQQELDPLTDPTAYLPNKEMNMRLVIPTTGTDLDAPIATVFGRAPTFVFVDPETLEFEAIPNPALSAAGGAGVQAAQTVVQRGVQAIIAPRLGPNAFRVIQAAGVPVYEMETGTLREAVQAFQDGRLLRLQTPGADHVGLGGAHRRRYGRGGGG